MHLLFRWLPPWSVETSKRVNSASGVEPPRSHCMRLALVAVRLSVAASPGRLRRDAGVGTLAAMSRTNPFPDMNPYMEHRWANTHFRLMALAMEALGNELPDDLTVAAGEQVDVIGPPDEKGRNTRPDIAIIEPAESWERGLPPVWTPGPEAGAVAVTEPDLLVVEEPPHRWIEVRTDAGELITVIEVPGPANKTTYREAYRLKRREYVAAGVNFVEIDLLRGGGQSVDVNAAYYQERYARLGEHYAVCASRRIMPGRREVYPSPLRQRLPAVRIPLRTTDPDVPLDIQALVDRCYTSGRYWKLDYTRPLHPPPGADDAAWVATRLKEAGLLA